VERNSHVELSPLIELGNVNSVRNLVIQALGEEWPLNVRRLHTKIERQRPGVSYHAVHKAVQQLVCEAIVKRGEAGYIIDSDWVQRALSLLEGMKNRKCGECGTPLYLPDLKNFKEGDSKTFIFENLAEADTYRKKLQMEYCSQPNCQHPYCGIALHLRTPVTYTERSMNILDALSKRGVQAYIVVAGATPIDKWCADYYRNEFVNVQIGISSSESCETMILGDIVTQLYISAPVLERISQIYSTTRNVAELNIPEFYRHIYQHKAETKFIVMRNSEIAAQLRTWVMSCFEKQPAVQNGRKNNHNRKR